MIPQAAQQMSYAPAGGSAYAPQGFTAGNVSGDGFTNIPEIHHHSSFHSRKLSKIPKMKELRLSSIYWSAAIPFSIETNMEEMK